jgi:hypothetical protein
MLEIGHILLSPIVILSSCALFSTPIGVVLVLKLALFFQLSNKIKPQMDADKRGSLLFVIPVKTGIHY